jgi:hypothetical protein
MDAHATSKVKGNSNATRLGILVMEVQKVCKGRLAFYQPDIAWMLRKR